jgi:hypothetical protein
VFVSFSFSVMFVCVFNAFQYLSEIAEEARGKRTNFMDCFSHALTLKNIHTAIKNFLRANF